jgi:hypothetical protein
MARVKHAQNRPPIPAGRPAGPLPMTLVSIFSGPAGEQLKGIAAARTISRTPVIAGVPLRGGQGDRAAAARAAPHNQENTVCGGTAGDDDETALRRAPDRSLHYGKGSALLPPSCPSWIINGGDSHPDREQPLDQKGSSRLVASHAYLSFQLCAGQIAARSLHYSVRNRCGGSAAS